MNFNKVLIVYDSGFGSTEDIARVMATELSRLGLQVECQNAENARAPLDGEAVIVGSPIRYDRWLPTVRQYVTRHQTILSQIPVAYFYTCLSLVQGASNPIDDKQVYDDTLLSVNTQVKPIMVAGFPGTLKLEVMPWYYRFPLKWIAKSKGVSEGDYRDWAMIKRWAHHFVHCVSRSVP